MLTKRQKLEIYKAARDYFVAEKANQPEDGEIMMGMCPKLAGLIVKNTGLKRTSTEIFTLFPILLPEWYNQQPSLKERQKLTTCSELYWFEWNDWDSRLEVLNKAIAICEQS